MNKKLWLISAVIVVATAGGFTFLLLPGRNPAVDLPAQVAEKTEPPTTPTTPEQSTPGSYKPYNAELVASTKGTKILFFYAAWCPQCRQLDAQITNGPLPDNVTIFKVDYDTNQTLRQKYGVQLQTTMVKIDDNGNAIQKFVAYDHPTLASLIKNML